ncbi:MAG: hypothetical protein SV686_06935 [Thermodesulfobacteriota bacterium]|nr:hypothetical protein [Thermodesulfobacteriota bacterium]
METWRFLNIDWLTYAETAIYRALLLRAISENVSPTTVSFMSFARPSVVLNYFNDPDRDINLELCRKQGIPVCRVLSGGGPILGDSGYIVTFLDIARDHQAVPSDPLQMMSKVLTTVAEEISERFDVSCRFRPLNDIEIRGPDGVWRKIGPSSCLYEEKAVKMGSAIQVKPTDVDLIASVIPAPPEKFADKEVKSIQERVTALEKVVGRSIDIQELSDLYRHVFESLFEVELIPGELTALEKGLYGEMEEEFTSYEYFMERSEKNLGKTPPGVEKKKIQFKVPNGPFVRIILCERERRIWKILISGTLHASPLKPSSPIHEIEKALEGSPLEKHPLASTISEVLSRPGFSCAMVTPQLLTDKILECSSNR